MKNTIFFVQVLSILRCNRYSLAHMLVLKIIPNIFLHLCIVLAEHIGDIAIVFVWQPLPQPLQGLLTALLDLEATPSMKRMNFP